MFLTCAGNFKISIKPTQSKNVFKYLSTFQPQKNPSGGCSENFEEKIKKKYFTDHGENIENLLFSQSDKNFDKKSILNHLTSSVMGS